MQPSVVIVFHFFVNYNISFNFLPSIIRIQFNRPKIRIFECDSLKSLHTAQN